MNRPVLVLASRHRPHEQLFLAFGAVSGVSFLAGAPEPASIEATMPPFVVILWAAGLVVSGAVGLIGCWWRGERGQLLEAGGLLVGCGSLLLYTSAAVSVAGIRALFPAGVVLTWFAANLWRVMQIRRELRTARRGAE